MSMKVLVLSTVFPNPQQPLHGLFVRERIRHLARYADIRVVSPVPWFQRRWAVPKHAPQEDLEVFHPTFVYVPAVFKALDGLFLFLSTVGHIAKLRRNFPFDLIDAHFAFPDGFAAVLLGRWFRRPVIITVRGSELVFVQHRLRRAAIGWALRQAARVIAVSAPLAALARELGTPAERLDVIPNGVDTVRFSPQPQNAARRTIGLSIPGPLIAMVGHLVPLKGFHRVIEALPELIAKFPDARLAIIGGPAAGSGDYPKQLANTVARLHLGQRVLLVGSQTPDQVATWLNASDVLVLDSDREGCPNVVREAMACGRPVVAGRVGEVERMVPPQGGILFDRPDDVGELGRSIELALRRKWDREAIRAVAERHTWDDVAARVMVSWTAVAGAVNRPTVVNAAIDDRS